MATIPPTKLALVRSLYYEQQLSAREISEKLHVPLNAVYYFMRRHAIARRSGALNSRIQFAKKPPSFSVPASLSKAQQRLKDIGVVLYWCEGYKQSTSHGVDFANSDPAMIALFMRFLREVCHIQENRTRAYVYCHDKALVAEHERYWQKVTGIPSAQFTKTYVRHNRSPHTRMKHGLVHIRYSDKKLLQCILDWIEEYKNESVGTQVVNGGTL